MTLIRHASEDGAALRFVVFSNDVNWCREQPTFTDCTFNEEGDEINCFASMVSCTHFIIANSTFSWWAAFLGASSRGGVVIAPSVWIYKTGNDVKNLYPPEWTIVHS